MRSSASSMETLRRARIRALQRRESVNAFLAGVLRRYADEGEQGDVFAELAEIADARGAGRDGRGRAWARDDLHRG